MKKWNKQRRGDLLLLLGIFVLVAALALGYGLTRREGAYVAVLQQGTELARYSLAQDRQIPIGESNLLVIEGGKARMLRANCPDQICVKHKPLNQTADPIVCLPNSLVVEVITNETENQLDGVS